MQRGTSSTSGRVNLGSGIGEHEESWVHYCPPRRGDDREVFTQYNYADANTKISDATATKGHVTVQSRRWVPAKCWKCGNCAKTVADRGMPERSGCSTRAGDHRWGQKTAWAVQSVSNRKLYYDKGGRNWAVSFHSF